MTKRSIDPKDKALFERAMADVRPLKDSAKTPLEVPNLPKVAKSDQPLPATWRAGQGLDKAQLAHPALEAQTREVRKDAPAPREGIDRKTRRGLARGRTHIDRTIDLHGLNQVEAFAVLVRTIERAVLRDMKTVLVITGKGGARFSQTESGSAAQRTRADFAPYEGVLKRMVPVWLSGASLRPYVESYAGANPEHGGEGALYVRLRKRKPA